MFRYIAVALVLAGMVVRVGIAQDARSLREGFANPPADVRPSVWWFWGETITTDHGITQDLEAMKRVGIGGAVIYEQVFTDRPDALKSLSPDWLARVRFAAQEAARLGMVLELNLSSGYVSGGPWITPELGMQRLVASEIMLQGGRSLSEKLPQPPTKLNYYKDVAVLAWPQKTAPLPVPLRSSSQGDVKLDALFDPKNAEQIRIVPDPQGKPVWIALDYQQPVTLRSITYQLSPSANKAPIIATQMPGNWSDDNLGQAMRVVPPIGELQSSDDGAAWKNVCTLPEIGRQHDSWNQLTVAFPTTTARYFRLNLHDWSVGEPNHLKFENIELSPEARIDRWESKSGNVVNFSDPDQTPPYKPDEIISADSIVNLTDHLAADGTLTWNAPPGTWHIMRLGHTPTGAKTKHGRAETMGLHSDSLSRRATKVQFDNYVGKIQGEISKVPGAKLYGVTMDSAEQGSQNWTQDFAEQFKRRKGYDIVTLLPAMMGKVVGDTRRCDRFLFDVRRTIADLMTDEYFGVARALCNEKGIKLMAEAPGIATCMPCDNLQAKAPADVPMGEFWMSQERGTIDCKEAAIAAHIYGKPVAAAEAFTGSRADAHPATMKPRADAALALGINKFYPLAYLHQPWDDRKPGVTEDRFYLPYQRHNTWWEYSREFWDTLSRSCFMMQQGKPVADVLYYLGNDAPVKIATARLRPIPPDGYDYDACSDDALINRVSVLNGRIVLPDGVNYRLLILASGDRVTARGAAKIQSLIRDGAQVLLDKKWLGSPSLSDGEQGDAEVKKIADELWGSNPAATGKTTLGKGCVYWGIEPAALLRQLSVPRDFEVMPGDSQTDLLFSHRRTPSMDCYFLANHLGTPARFEAMFNAQRKHAALWDPQFAKQYHLPFRPTDDGRSRVAMHLEPYQSVLVIFDDESDATEPLPPLVEDCNVFQTLQGDWSVRFEPKRGAPEKAVFQQLISWTEHTDPGIQRFSGKATYEREFTLGQLKEGQRILVDLGKVNVMASVRVNGKQLQAVWKSPYAVDVTHAVHPGVNQLSVDVVNLWVNRLIADAGLPPEQRITWTTYNPYRPGDKQLPSGLLGPVVLRSFDQPKADR